MEWENLKSEKCPRCAAFLDKGTMYQCRFCNFKISFGKAFEISGVRSDLLKDAGALLKKNKNERRKFQA